MLIPYRIFVLKKDKAFSYEKEVHVYFVKWEYVLVPDNDRWERR
jgi:hypothetical protein